MGIHKKDELIIPEELNNIIKKERIFKYCTLPELEILLIINEKQYKDYQKSIDKKPKTYAKRNIIYNKKRYNQSASFIMDYYGGKRVAILVSNLKQYKKIKKHKKDELYLADLLK